MADRTTLATPEPHDTTECSTCHARIIWAETINGKAMPVDTQPAQNGNIQLQARPGRKPLARALRVDQQFGKQGRLHLSHFVTCPQGGQHRKPRRRTVP